MNNRLETRALLAAAGLLLSVGAAQAQSLDESINGIFAPSTGWFANFIFSNFPGTSFPWIVAWLVVGALNSARHSVRIMTPYFIPDRALLAAINSAAL